MRRFDILEKWFEEFSVRSLQDQRSSPSFMFCGKTLGTQNQFDFPCDGEFPYEEYEKFKQVVIPCAEMVYNNYATLEKSYESRIIPIFEGNRKLSDTGAAWIFTDLALARIVSPEEGYYRLKPILIKHMEYMLDHYELNVADYYPILDKIFARLESIDFGSYR